ncbi:hypothetical protein NGC32_01010 [Kluyvera cryocrescens]|uniref:hypothetical protein n=1 Tax=Kluyvera cryocrescens TaxID=580 RepID=UPI002DB5E388|nr:hypothetical protein [Kluyvera cryocrescens]MEB7711308.1 hypothetical protein [Kluyvera cryocrescens]
MAANTKEIKQAACQKFKARCQAVKSGVMAAKWREKKEKRTMRVHDACHKGILLEKCLSLVHQAVKASS